MTDELSFLASRGLEVLSLSIVHFSLCSTDVKNKQVQSIVTLRQIKELEIVSVSQEIVPETMETNGFPEKQSGM